MGSLQRFIVHIVADSMFMSWRSLDGFTPVAEEVVEPSSGQVTTQKVRGTIRLNPIGKMILGLGLMPMESVTLTPFDENIHLILQCERPCSEGILVGQEQLMRAVHSVDWLLAGYGFEIQVTKTEHTLCLFLRNPIKVSLVPRNPSMDFKILTMTPEGTFL